MSNRTISLVLCALASLPSACASDSSRASLYIHPNADFSAYRRVAVLPLENLTTDRFAGERLREILVIELSAQGLFEIIETGEVNRVLRVQNLGLLSDIGPEEIAGLGEALGAEALIYGSVLEFRERRSGTLTAPDISISLRMLDVETGLVVWSSSDARTGVAVVTRLFGVGEESQSDTARELVRDLISTLNWGGGGA